MRQRKQRKVDSRDIRNQYRSGNGDRGKEKEKEPSERMENERRQYETPETWEDRLEEEPTILDRMKTKKTKKNPIRKPVDTTNWFGLDTTTETTDEEDNNWKTVGRVEKTEEKRRKTAARKLEKMRDCAGRASRMICIGPITQDNVDYFKQDNVTFEDAKKEALKEYLVYNLGYEQEEVENLRIQDTRMSTKGDEILNVALGTEDEVREIYREKSRK